MEVVIKFDSLEEAEGAGFSLAERAAAVLAEPSGEVFEADIWHKGGYCYSVGRADAEEGGFVFTQSYREEGQNGSGDRFTWREVPHL